MRERIQIGVATICLTVLVLGALKAWDDVGWWLALLILAIGAVVMSAGIRRFVVRASVPREQP